MDALAPAADLETEKSKALARRYGHALPPAGPWNETVASLLDHRSVRGFLTDPVPAGTLETLIAAAQSAAYGAVLGALFGWLFGLFDWVNPLISGLLLALYGAIFGAVAGGLLGMLGHALTGGRRDFSSVAGMRADSYDILVSLDPDVDIGLSALMELQRILEAIVESAALGRRITLSPFERTQRPSSELEMPKPRTRKVTPVNAPPPSK